MTKPRMTHSPKEVSTIIGSISRPITKSKPAVSAKSKPAVSAKSKPAVSAKSKPVKSLSAGRVSKIALVAEAALVVGTGTGKLADLVRSYIGTRPNDQAVFDELMSALRKALKAEHGIEKKGEGALGLAYRAVATAASRQRAKWYPTSSPVRESGLSSSPSESAPATAEDTIAALYSSIIALPMGGPAKFVAKFGSEEEFLEFFGITV